jgi:hypothetical protein
MHNDDTSMRVLRLTREPSDERAVLMDLSRSRDPGLLTELRARAMPGLIEIARWDAGHAMTRSILGRLAGMSEENINKIGDQSDDVENLINAVQKVR